MSDDNNGKFNLSRRKALAGIGAAGAAVGLGGIGTVAQLSDTEEQSVTFTAGGLDGVLSWQGSYNGEPVADSPFVTMGQDVTGMTADSGGIYGDNSIPIDVHLDDVKPGDYGCVNFSIEVQSNEAWVASGLNVVENIDYKNYEPEVDSDPNVTQANAGPESETGDFTASSYDELSGEQLTQGELAQNIWALPYYDGDGTCTFFDSSSSQFDASAYDTNGGDSPGPFWSNSQTGSDFVSQQGYQGTDPATGDSTEYYLAPRHLVDISQNVNAVDTAHWNNSGDGSLGFQTAQGGSASVASGSVMLDGDVASNGTSNNNTQGVSPLSPGDTLNFGYDFHIPFDVGNEIQGDRASITMDFAFIQSRHTEAPNFTSFAP